MLINFKFEIDEESYELRCEIVNKMVELFHISHEEAINRMNSQWRGQIIKGDGCMVFHEDEEYWANSIYYTDNSYWWMQEMGDRLKVKVYNPEKGRYE